MIGPNKATNHLRLLPGYKYDIFVAMTLACTIGRVISNDLFCVGFSISSIAETRGRALIFFLGKWFLRPGFPFRSTPNGVFIVVHEGLEPTTLVRRV